MKKFLLIFFIAFLSIESLGQTTHAFHSDTRLIFSLDSDGNIIPRKDIEKVESIIRIDTEKKTITLKSSGIDLKFNILNQYSYEATKTQGKCIVYEAEGLTSCSQTIQIETSPDGEDCWIIWLENGDHGVIFYGIYIL